ncbi:MAG: hypothetical protein J7M32_10285 [Deltaproteobacteria bacterium]|nr:hypothetical protein [Deltaproteobacteria bacterium]
MDNEWWRERRDELLKLADQASPLYVFNDETLNEIFFDLLSLNVLERLFYTVHANPHPKILRKAVEQGVGFSCVLWKEAERLLRDFPRLDPEMILFFPESFSDQDLEKAFSRRVHVASDPDPYGHWPDVFQNRGVFVRWGSCQTRADTGSKKISVEGFYCPLRVDVLRMLGSDAVGPCLKAEAGDPPEAIPLILRDVGEKTLKDVPGLAEHLEAVAHAVPRFRLWLEVPKAMMARAGCLIMEVARVEEKDGLRWIRVHGETGALGTGHESLRLHQLINLTRPDLGQSDLTVRIGGEAGIRGKWIDVANGPAVVYEGDVLLFTEMGAPGAEAFSGGPGLNRPGQHYLHARSMCPVSIFHEKTAGDTG